MNVYVGNLAHEISEQDLKAAFEPFGQVAYAKIIKDRETGQPRGFGFVEMPNEQEAQAAIAEMNGKDLNGRPLRVNVGRAKDDEGGGRPPRGNDRGGRDSGNFGSRRD